MFHLQRAYQKSIIHFIGKTEDSDIVILMHNLLKYSDNYSMTPESWWIYYRDEVIL